MTRKTIETCELDVYLVDKPKLIHQFNPFHQRLWQWQAKANGPKGTYVAAWSATFEAYATYAGYATHPRSKTSQRLKSRLQLHKADLRRLVGVGRLRVVVAAISNRQFSRPALTRPL